MKRFLLYPEQQKWSLNIGCCLISYPGDRQFFFCFLMGGTRSYSSEEDAVNRAKIILFTNPSARARYDTRSIFLKRSLTDLNSEFFLLLDELPHQG